MNYALVGHGRMGRAIDAHASTRGHRRVALVDAPLGRGLTAEDLGGADTVFEFTEPDAARRNVHELVDLGLRVVCGTTGWEPGTELARRAVAAGAGMVLAPNFSLGVNLFFRVVRQAGELYSRFELHDPFVEEAHHRGKRDVPSGTARRLAAIVRDADPRIEQVVEGNPEGLLPAGAMQVASVRAGSEPGRHTVGFDGPHDRVTLSHAARGREGFAHGAVLAAEWLDGRQGLFTFEEVVDDILASARGSRGAGGRSPEEER